ncbi:hypothetical protein [Lacipirellula sp.]|uniref:hypothetical protein n=1 Tax=Lacipirellula sp. TaxID=2691419 RepID=UPI003D0DE64F
MRSSGSDERPLQIHITGRNIHCETRDDRDRLSEAKAIIANPEAADVLLLDNLYAIRSACQRYSLGKAQRALKIAIDIRSLPGPQ